MSVDKQDEVIIDNVHFWGMQMREHLELLYLGLNDTIYKDWARILNQSWSAYLKWIFESLDIDAYKVFLDASDFAKIVDFKLDSDIKELIDQTEIFNESLLKVLRENKWIGWIFLSIVEHMQDETLYFKKIVNRQFNSQREEIDFIIHHHKTEMRATTHLLDPAPENDELITTLDSYIKRNIVQWFEENDAEVNKNLEIAHTYSEELTRLTAEAANKIENYILKSIIPLTLAKHVNREFIRFTRILNYVPHDNDTNT